MSSYSKLYQAIKRNDLSAVEKLLNVSFFELSKAANVNATYEAEAFTPLMLASKDGFREMSELLIRYGADIDKKNNQGYTSLLLASKNGHAGIVELLIGKGADINVKNRYRNSSLIFATFNNHTDIVKLLVSNKADVNEIVYIENFIGDYPLAIASRNGNISIVEMLISVGADVNAVNTKGETALIIATEKGFNEIVEVLIAKGANVYAENKGRVTSMRLAILNGYKGRAYYEIVRLLIENGFDINTKDITGKSPVELALTLGNKEIADFLIANSATISPEAIEAIERESNKSYDYFCNNCSSFKTSDEVEEDFYDEDEWVRIYHYTCKTCKTKLRDSKGNLIITRVSN